MAGYSRKIQSICPVCRTTIEGAIYERDGKIFLKKACREHGTFDDIIHGHAERYAWNQMFLKDGIKVQGGVSGRRAGCPHDCGLCENHVNTPAIALIDVTNRCNLNCPICFANANARGVVVEPTYEDIVEIMTHFRSLKPSPPITVQFTGGEPTLREDLPRIVRTSVDLGFQHIMITTNGLKMAESIDYCRELAEAGANAIYVQFDGLDPATWIKTRGRNLLPQKLKFIENWRAVNAEFRQTHGKPGAGVALVPTIAKGLNVHEIPAIIDFAVKNIDVVVAIVFQPVSLCGRVDRQKPLEMRFTSSELQDIIDRHTQGVLRPWYPISAVSEFAKLIDWFDDVETVEFSCHPDCGFANWLIADKKTGTFEGLKDYVDMDGALAFSKSVWSKVVAAGKQFEAGALYRKRKKLGYLIGLRKYQLKKGHASRLLQRLILKPTYETVEAFMFGPCIMVGCMHFQDSYNMDTERTRRCLAQYGYKDPRDGTVKIVPFCTMNTIHRERVEAELGHSIRSASIGESRDARLAG
jgi:uncharacterized radical SAM superfamily Fe-S cluster-containing enzyme